MLSAALPLGCYGEVQRLPPIVTGDANVPPTNLTATELQSRADELSRMAETATTMDTRDALRRLSARFAQLAEARGAPRTVTTETSA